MIRGLFISEEDVPAPFIDSFMRSIKFGLVCQPSPWIYGCLEVVVFVDLVEEERLR